MDTAFQRPAFTTSGRDRWLFAAFFFADFEFLYWQISGLYSHFHTWILIYVPLSQTTSNDNNENHDKRIEECRRKLLKCSFLASRFSVSVTQRPLKCTLWSLSSWPAGGDRVSSRRINHLLASKLEPLSNRGPQSFSFSQRPQACHCLVESALSSWEG